MKKLIFLLSAAAALFLGSCPQPTIEWDKDKFWALDFTKKPSKYYQVNASQLYEGEKCFIYAENKSGLTITDAEKIAHEYDTKIYSLMVENFCKENFDVNYYGTINSYANTLEYANSLARSNGKLVILMLDIKDGYSGRLGEGYYAGYFSSLNFYGGSNSNNRSMIYVDTNPGMKNPEEMYATIAHELQHLVNFVTSRNLRPKASFIEMDTWINEGLSAMAEYFYSGSLKKRIDWFIDDPKKTIAQGNNFYVWDNYQNIADAVLDEYATVYMFFQWLYLQAGENNKLIKNIATSDNYDYKAVAENVSSIIPGGDDWEKLLRTWMAANYINNPDGEYGYKGKTDFRSIKVKPIKNDADKINLYPGEGVYSSISASYSVPANGSGDNIRYAGLRKNNSPGTPGGINNAGSSGLTYTGDMLLTYNKNTNKAMSNNGTEIGTIEIGFLTGQSAGPLAIPAIGSSEADIPYPLVRDTREIMRRNNQAELAPPEGKITGK